ncbi:spry domain-containing protein [Cyclospora cayetanensis]|uniref:Spry domain-containing protein n=1 Tax=Cyclospora cayetanensis TaxID=88456 RepID=A0A1D3CSL7_9EIME|nr:spry domain-containing protein [Cyclospora cayetanensis]
MPTGLFRPMGPDADDAEVDDSYEKEINELLPSIIDSRRHMHYIQLSQEGLVATFVGKGDYTDVGAVQSDHAFPRTCPIAYYEIRILKAAAVRPQICVGLAPASTLLNRTPGLEPRSVGYRAEDGRCHYRKGRTGPSSSDSVNWEPFGPAYGQGDIVGCGILNSSRGIFFTKNGAFVGHACKVSALCDVFPTISMKNTGDAIRVNFTGPFLFNLRLLFHSPESATADYLSQEEGGEAFPRGKEDQEAVLDMWPAAVSRRLSRSLVRRADVVALIMEGRISEAVLFLAEHFPLVLEPTTDDASCLARALLYTQEVVECIRPPNGDFTAAIRCMQSRIAPLTSQVPPFIQKAIKVRLYSWATKDSSHHLLDRNQGESETFTSSADFGHIAKKR